MMMISLNYSIFSTFLSFCYKKRTTALLFLFFLSYLFSTTSLACTEITLKAKNGTVITGRTLDFVPPLNSYIVTVPRGTIYKSTLPHTIKSLSWKSKYGFVYFNAFGQAVVSDGMNEKGLSFAVLYLPGYTTYPSQKDIVSTKHAISIYNLGSWVLSNYKTVAQVESALTHVTVIDPGLNIPNYGKVHLPLHVIITDPSGKSIVIEWHHKKMRIYDDKFGILTNSPTFDWQMNNLKNYINLSPYSSSPIKINGLTFVGTGQGSGMHGLPGDATPPSRFVRMFFLTQTALPVKSTNEALTLAEHILGAAFVPKGFARGEKSNQKDEIDKTQWEVYKDLKHRILYFSSYNYPVLRKINLKKINFSVGAPSLKIAVSSPMIQAINVTDKLSQ